MKSASFKTAKRKPKEELKEEFPSGSDYISNHDTKFRQFAELLLTTGQGTSQEEVVLVAELWAGEGTLYDPKTHAQIAVWFERGTLGLGLTGCEIKSGTRFGERNAPDAPKTLETTTTEVVTGTQIKASAQGHVSAEQVGLSASAGGKLAGSVYRHAKSQLKAITKREKTGTQSVIASASGWTILPPIVDRDQKSPGGHLYKYITTDDRLCDLVLRKGARRIRIDAYVDVYPNDLRYRIDSLGPLKRAAATLTTNQNKLIQLLLKKGIGPATDLGLRVATASVRLRSTSKAAGS